MCKKLTYLASFILLAGLSSSASALVVDGFQQWNQRIQIASLGGLEITSTGHAKFSARVDQDATDVTIHPGGILETLDTYKLPDGHPEPLLTNVYVYGTWNAHDIQSFGVERAAYIYIGPKGVINLDRGYEDSNTSYNVLAWLDQESLGGRSLFVAPELDPQVWSIQIDNLGGGACRITAVGPPPVIAGMPSPDDEATDVPRDVVLGWTPGEYAPPINGHKVYLSENFNDVNDGIGGIATDANSYVPGQRLDFGTTYYWRIDEVNGPPDYTVYEGEVWSFTTEPVGYPIENITVTASSTHQADMGAENTINGSGLDANDLHSLEPTDMWLSSSEPLGAWIEFQFDKVYKLHELLVWNSNQMVESLIGFGFKGVTIEHSTNGTDYTTLADVLEFAQAPGADGYAHNTTVDFGGAEAKYVKITASSNWGFLPQFGLSEVRFLYVPIRAREPSPDSGATDVDVDVTLSWKAGREAAQHDVYLSTDEQAVIDGTAPVTTVTEASHGPLSLDLGKSYYWKINEVNEAETPTTWESDLWSFTTREFLIVDDFEAYNDLNPEDTASNRIFLTWIDGYGIDTNGSLVGYESPPFCERTIVHSGSQSMPLAYNNTGGAAYSEAERTFAAAQNWTQAGVATLVLYFHGDAGNTGQLYVKVNGSKVVYDDNAGDIAKVEWKQWTIDLAPLGAGVQNVTKLVIGIDGNGATGTLYVDDIRLYRLAPQAN